jgi:predicted small lipoprotein YifL
MRAVRPVVVLVLALALAGCGQREPVIDPGDDGNYTVRLDPSRFVATIDNPWLPFTPGSRWVYEAGGGASNEVVVTHQTRQIMGITATVVRDVETDNGELVEETSDWYAQDRDGNVWYLGEDTRAYENGRPTPAGSWEAGVDGALPGIIMKAHPRVGDAYRQEFYRGEAEDMGKVVRVGDSQTVPLRTFDGLLVTQDWTPLEPRVVEEKYYAKGVGLVLETTVRGGSGRNELVSYQPGG